MDKCVTNARSIGRGVVVIRCLQRYVAREIYQVLTADRDRP